MELLALVLINIVFGVVLYYIISIKVTNSVRDYQIQKLKKEIQNHTLNFFKESESYLTLMDSRIQILKNLIQKAESMGIDFREMQIREELEKVEAFQKKDPIKDIPKIPEENKVVYSKEKIDKNLEFSSAASPSEGGLLASLGKVFKSMMGVTEIESGDTAEESLSATLKQPAQTKRHLDFSVGGNPFEDSNPKIQNLQDSPSDFQVLLYNKNTKLPKDEIKVSISTALKEIPEDSGKVDKVVFLLKKGYTHFEISEELGLAMPEISLIETIKLERNRRL